jgi:tetratricopeptide (TPR) repeat protein
VLVNELGGIYYRHARYADAERAYLRALRIWEKAPSPPTGLGAALDNLGAASFAQAKFGETERYYLRARHLQELKLGKSNPETAVTLGNLACVYRALGRNDDAEPLYRRALAIEESAFGPESSKAAAAQDNLAGLYASAGRYRDAERLLRRALAARDKLVGPDDLERYLGEDMARLRVDVRDLRQEQPKRRVPYGFVAGWPPSSTCSWLTTCVTPFTFLVMRSALTFCLSSRTLPRRVTTPLFTSTSIPPPLTSRSSARRCRTRS